MLKRFYFLSFALAFMSLGATAQLYLTENFQYNDGCLNAPTIIGDNTSNLMFSFNGSISGTTAGNLSNFTIYRDITLYFYRTNTGVNTLEGSYAMPQSVLSSLNTNFDFGAHNIPDLPTGDYEVEMHVKYTNGGGNSTSNIEMEVQENGVISCASQDFSNQGVVECYLGRIACFKYQECHDVTLSSNKFGTSIHASISGGTGPFNIQWFISADKITAPSTPTTTGTTIVNKRCGSWFYSVLVIDLATGCSVRVGREFNRPCFEPVKDKTGKLASTKPPFDLFPNPVNDALLRVNYDLPSNTAQAQLIIHNLQGQVVKTIALDPLSTEMKIKVEGLTNGLYIATLQVDGERIGNERMLINR